MKIFTSVAVARAIENNGQSQDRPNQDRYYPAKTRRMWNKTIVPLSDLTKIAKAVPLVTRGGESIPIGTGEGQINYIDVPPVDVEDHVSVADANDLETASGVDQQDFVNNEVRYIQDTVGLTADALSAISMRGNLQYPIKTKEGMVTFSVNFGSTNTYSVAKKWDLDTTKLSDIVKDLVAIRKKLKAAGYGSRIRHDIGLGLFSALVDKITAIGNDTRIKAKVEDEAVFIGGFKLELNTNTYYDPKTKTDKDTVGDKELMAWSESAPKQFLYVKLDVADKGWARLPVYINPVLANKKTYWTIYGMSKPFPVPVPKSICWCADVTS